MQIQKVRPKKANSESQAKKGKFKSQTIERQIKKVRQLKGKRKLDNQKKNHKIRQTKGKFESQANKGKFRKLGK